MEKNDFDALTGGPEPIRCQDGCKRYVVNEEAANAQGWERLQITGRWRCPVCRRMLLLANGRFDQGNQP